MIETQSVSVNVVLVPESEGHRLCARAHAELPENALNVGGHGLRADEKRLGDLFLIRSGSQKVEYLMFARRQRSQLATGAFIRAH
jgi:hypothetical protein